MKVLYVHQFFNTPLDGGNIRSYYLASEMVRAGIQVEMITSHLSKNLEVKIIDGIRVTYLPSSYQNHFGYWKRIRAYLHFAVMASWFSIKIKNVDLCYVMTTPLTTGLIALFNKFVLGRKYVFEVGDLWPWVPVEMGVIKNYLLTKALYSFERYCYDQSAGCVGLSPPISKYIREKSPTKPVETVYNVSECTFFRPENGNDELKIKFGITDEFVVTYTGTFGFANDLSRMMYVLKGLQHLPIKFLFVGMGAEKEEVTRLAKDLELTNCSILDFQPKQAMKEILAISDAMFISFANYPSLFTGSPNKLFDALAAGLVVITNFEGWIAELVKKEGCGFSFIHDSSADLEKQISPYLGSRKLLEDQKHNARALAETHFELGLQSKKQIDFIYKVCERQKRRKNDE